MSEDAPVLEEIRDLLKPRIEVKSEPLTYEELAPRSYFRDLVMATYRADGAAKERLERHAVEMESRANPNRIQGQGGYFAPPAWLIQKFATSPRRERVLAGLCPDIPTSWWRVSQSICRGSQRATSPTQSLMTPQSPEQDVVDANVQSPVVTIAGQGDFSMQLLEQSPQGAHLDWAMFKDLGAAYDQSLEQQLIYGTGSSVQPYQQFYGITNVTGIVGVTASSAASVSTGMYTYFGQMASRIGNNRDAPPEVWLMTTSRWAWIGSSEDSQNRPIVTPDVHPPEDGDVDGPQAVSTLLGWPVYVDDAIPTNLGATANQDEIIACRPSDMILLEGTPRTMVGVEVLSGTLQARLQLRNFVAFIGGRYPTGISVLTGAGMVVQSGFTS